MAKVSNISIHLCMTNNLKAVYFKASNLSHAALLLDCLLLCKSEAVTSPLTCMVCLSCKQEPHRVTK